MANEEVKETEGAKGEEARPTNAGGARKGGLLQNKMVLIAIILVVQLAIALVVAKVIVSKALPKEEQAAEEQVEPDEKEEGRGSIVMLDDIIVNLKEGDRLYYLKLTVGLEVPNATVQKEVEARSAQLRDIIISMVSGMRISELDTLEDRNALKIRLLNKLSDVLKSGDLIQVYFSNFVIQ